MVEKARHDYIQLSYLCGIALSFVLFLMAISLSLDASRFGFIVHPKQEDIRPLYQPEAFANAQVQAKAYIVYDLVDKKVIASRNQDQVLPLASLSKVMTAVSALLHNDPHTKITLKDQYIDGGYDLGLKKGQVWDLIELLKYTLVFSSNDGAETIAASLGGREAFLKQMNTDSTLFGLSLHFTDPAGLDLNGQLGGIGTVLDVAKLFGIARKYQPELLEATTHSRVTVHAGTSALSGVPNTNQEIEKFFGAEASKTGFTDDAGGNLGVVVDVSLGHPVVIVVLGSTKEGRFEDVSILYKALLKSLN